MIALRYVELLSSRQFVANVATGGFFYAGTFAYIDFYRINPRWYGLLFGMGILGMMVMNQVNARLLNRLGSDTLMAIGGMLAALSGGILAMATWSGRGGLPLLISGSFLYVSSTGLVLANALVRPTVCWFRRGTCRSLTVWIRNFRVCSRRLPDRWDPMADGSCDCELWIGLCRQRNLCSPTCNRCVDSTKR